MYVAGGSRCRRNQLRTKMHFGCCVTVSLIQTLRCMKEACKLIYIYIYIYICVYIKLSVVFIKVFASKQVMQAPPNTSKHLVAISQHIPNILCDVPSKSPPKHTQITTSPQWFRHFSINNPTIGLADSLRSKAVSRSIFCRFYKKKHFELRNSGLMIEFRLQVRIRRFGVMIGRIYLNTVS